MKLYRARLKENGLKNTPRREAILSLFAEAKKHLTPEELWLRLKKKFSRCGLPSVYRNLESLAACGLLTRIQQFDRKKHYALCPRTQDGHHHHITCVKCGKIDDIEGCALGGKKKIKGYRVVGHFMQVNGVCPACAQR